MGEISCFLCCRFFPFDCIFVFFYCYLVFTIIHTGCSHIDRSTRRCNAIKGRLSTKNIERAASSAAIDAVYKSKRQTDKHTQIHTHTHTQIYTHTHALGNRCLLPACNSVSQSFRLFVLIIICYTQ